jgi:hypothetical protein
VQLLNVLKLTSCLRALNQDFFKILNKDSGPLRIDTSHLLANRYITSAVLMHQPRGHKQRANAETNTMHSIKVEVAV